MIDLSTDLETLEAAVGLARERNIRIPTFRQMRDPSLMTPSFHRAGAAS